MKNLKQKVIITYLLLIVITLFISCNKNEKSYFQSKKIEVVEFRENSNTQILFSENGLTVIFKSIRDENNVLSEVRIINNLFGKELHKNTFNLKKDKSLYKLGLFSEIEDVSDKLISKLTPKKWGEIRNIYESFLKNLYENMDINHFHSEIIQSAFFHLSIFNTIVRSFNNKKGCECTPLPAYIVGETPFWCQEDYLYDVDELFDFYNENKERLLTFEGGKKEYNYIKKLIGNRKKISNKELFSLHYSTIEYKNFVKKAFEKSQDKNLRFGKDRDDCWSGMCGSDLGCCGNYGGCCWFASIACLRHDLTCINCDKWHCGWACRPGIGYIS